MMYVCHIREAKSLSRAREAERGLGSGGSVTNQKYVLLAGGSLTPQTL